MPVPEPGPLSNEEKLLVDARRKIVAAKANVDARRKALATAEAAMQTAVDGLDAARAELKRLLGIS